MLPSIFQEVKDLAIHPNYKRPKIGAGELKTPVFFFQFIPGEGPEPGEIVKKELHSCKAQNLQSVNERHRDIKRQRN